jgi:UDP-N-acetylmuramoyl-L-alanyl-D-glutamate--2,6-diaminopimelate ligase
MLEKILRFIEKLIPKSIYRFFQPAYHYLLALAGAILYRFPSKEIFVIGVTGTKGKTTTSEYIHHLLTEAGYKTALVSTIQFKIGEKSERNLFKMTTPGRFFLQKLLRRAIKKGCTYAVIEMSSEAVLQFRHRFIYLDAFVFTNLSPEHIERHGSYEKYRAAKFEIAKRCAQSGKHTRIAILNGDEAESSLFASLPYSKKYTYRLEQAKPYELGHSGRYFSWNGRTVHTTLPGTFNILNALAALTLGEALHIPTDVLLHAVESFKGALGRVQRIEAGQNFTVVVDYAHTVDSLTKLYEAFSGTRRICVLGGTGGGRDKGKREKMGKVASSYCDEIILTNEDPYDEDPESIVADIKAGITNKKIEIIMDRREAIRTALRHANLGSTVLISGKGTDPYIMEAKNKRTPWSDAEIAREELQKLV